MSSSPVGICFVCLANICRSPTAAGVFRHLVAEAGLGQHFRVESAGIGAWVGGDPPHPLAVAAAAERGIVVAGTARRFDPEDFDRFEYVLAADREVYEGLKQLARTPEDHSRIHYLRAFEPRAARNQEVPDPYRGATPDFRNVLDICENACRGLLDELRRRYGF